MAYQPTFASPYLTSIDVDTVGGNNFKCLINPRDTIEKYKINIYSVLDNSLVCYVRGEVVEGIQKKWYKAQGVPEVEIENFSNLIGKGVYVEETPLPIRGSFSDDAWLVVNVPENIGLYNGMNYKWNIEIWGTVADTQVLVETVYGDIADNPLSFGVDALLSEVSGRVTAGMYIKYKNELREIKSVGAWHYTNKPDIDYLSCGLYTPFTNELIKGDKCSFYSRKAISFDYYFEARLKPYVILNDIVPNNITSSRIAIDNSSVYQNTQPVLITKDNIDSYFSVTNGNDFYFVGDGSKFTANNQEASSATATTTLLAKADLHAISFDYKCKMSGAYESYTITVADKIIHNFSGNRNTTGSWVGSITSGQSILFKSHNRNPNNDTMKTDECSFYNMQIVDTAQIQATTPVEFYRFDLYLNNELIHTTNDVYSSNIEYNYDGLISGNTYTLKLTLCTDNNETITQEKNFTVEYGKFNAIINPVVTDIANKGCVRVDFSQNSSIDGVVEGVGGDVVYTEYKNDSSSTATGVNNAVTLNTYQSISWDNYNDNPLDLENTTQIIHWHGHPGFSGTILEKIDEQNPSRNVVVGYNGDAFYYKIGTNDIEYKSPFDNYPNYESAINAIVDENLLYKLSDADKLNGGDNIVSNDITNTYWWLIIIKKDSVEFKESKKYTETEV